ncbi:MAG: hypothetical protein H8D45_08470 [Bacteroidetes bacterium]|nr:hypothetical protein [Bacteroidota bacterium]
MVNTNKHRTITKQKSTIEKHPFTKFKIVNQTESKTVEPNADEYDGILIADETGNDEFLGSKLILENVGNVIEFKEKALEYITFEFIDTELNVIATLINLYNTVSDVKECFEKPLYQRYSA